MADPIWAGIDIGGTKTAVVISSNPPTVICRSEFPTAPENGPDHAVQRICSDLAAMLASQGIGSDSLAGIGISCGGPLDCAAGLVQAPPNLPTWVDVPIVRILSGKFNCPVHLENDANAGAIAEHRFGAGKGSRNMIFLTLGTGLGAGIIIHNQIYRGSSEMAGEIGHVRLTPTGPVGYNKAGSVEGWSSGGGMAQIALRAVEKARQQGRKSSLLDLPPGPIAAKDVGQAAENGDALALSIVTKSGTMLGRTLAILMDVVNPDRIVLGGLAVRLGDLLLIPAKKSLRKEALQQAYVACSIVPAALGGSIGDVAALCVAMDTDHTPTNP